MSKRRIVIDQAYIARVRKEEAPLQARAATLEKKRIPCKFCGYPTIIKFDGMTGLFQAKCSHCNLEGIYDGADYRHYSYIAHPEAIPIWTRDYA